MKNIEQSTQRQSNERQAVAVFCRMLTALGLLLVVQAAQGDTCCGMYFVTSGDSQTWCKYVWNSPCVRSVTAVADVSGCAVMVGANVTYTWSPASLEGFIRDGNTITIESSTVECRSITVTAVDDQGHTARGTIEIDFGTGGDFCPTSELCAHCTDIPGKASTKSGSVAVNVALGRCNFGRTAGGLSIHGTAPTNALCKPISLCHNYSTNETHCEVLTNVNGIYQVYAAECFAQVVTNGGASYTLNIYPTNATSGKTNGFYVVSGSPLRTVLVSNPEVTSSNKLDVTDEDGRVSNFEWRTNGWELRKGGTFSKQWKTEEWSSSNTVRTTTREHRNSGDNLLRKRVAVYQEQSFGRVRVREVNGTGAESRTNLFSHYTNAPLEGLLKDAIPANGQWEVNQYNDSRNVTNKAVAYLDIPPTNNFLLGRWFSYVYGSNAAPGALDTGLRAPTIPRCTIEYIGTNEVARSYTLFYSRERRDIQCVLAGAAWNNSSVTL